MAFAAGFCGEWRLPRRHRYPHPIALVQKRRALRTLDVERCPPGERQRLILGLGIGLLRAVAYTLLDGTSAARCEITDRICFVARFCLPQFSGGRVSCMHG
jgi:hypothetical protein